MQNVHFTPPELARLIGVNESTVKRWVDRGLLPAEKTAGGHRRVSRKDLELFVKSYSRIADKSYVLKRIQDTGEEITYEDYYYKLLSRQYTLASNLLHQAYITGMSVVDIIEKIIIPTLVLVGQGWRDGVLSIESEHRMSYVIREHIVGMGQFIEHATGKVKKPKRVLLACVPDDNHELSLHVIALALRSFGHEVEVLGINIDADELERGVVGFQPDYIALSKVYSLLRIKKGYVTKLAKTLKRHNTKLIVGGSGWRDDERELLTERVGSFKYCQSLQKLKDL